MRSLRLDYDTIADRYDADPNRAKPPDPELAAFVRGQALRRPLSALDIACGTGNQLVATRAAIPDARLVGIDRSAGMLRQARGKAPDIAWIRADAAALPFRGASFDFVSCQFAFHHIADKTGTLAETLRIMRRGGRFASRNMCPEQCQDWVYYEYFPAAREADARDFWPVATITSAMETAGFSAVTAEYEHVRSERNLGDWLARVRQRHICSQLQTISDADYQAGIGRLQREIGDPTATSTRPNHICLVTVRGDKLY